LVIHRFQFASQGGCYQPIARVDLQGILIAAAFRLAWLHGAAQVYKDLEIPESKRESLPHSSPNRAETNGTSRAGSGHLDSPANGKAELDPVVLGCHLVDFWTNICLCQSLIVEEAEDNGPPIYQASPALTV